jgi:hypothetical protein
VFAHTLSSQWRRALEIDHRGHRKLIHRSANNRSCQSLLMIPPNHLFDTYSCQWKIIKNCTAPFPDFGVLVFRKTFICVISKLRNSSARSSLRQRYITIESVNASNISTFMIASRKCNSIWVSVVRHSDKTLIFRNDAASSNKVLT